MEEIVVQAVIAYATKHPSVAALGVLLVVIVGTATGVANVWGGDTSHYSPRVEAFVRICGYVGTFLRGISKWAKQLYTGVREEEDAS